MPEETRGKRVAVVMAGGSGERFWPLSRRLRPKQLLRLTGRATTTWEESVARLAPLIAPEDVYIATSRILVQPIRAAKSGVPDENVIAEPCKRNTSGCLAYATAHILAKEDVAEDDASCGNLSMAVVTADQSISDGAAFRATVATVLDAADREGALATIGIVPTRRGNRLRVCAHARRRSSDRRILGRDSACTAYPISRRNPMPPARRVSLRRAGICGTPGCSSGA